MERRCPKEMKGRGPKRDPGHHGRRLHSPPPWQIAFDGRIAPYKRGKAEVDFGLLRKKRATLLGSSPRSQPSEMKAKLAATQDETILALSKHGTAQAGDRRHLSVESPLEKVADGREHMDGVPIWQDSLSLGERRTDPAPKRPMRYRCQRIAVL